MAFFPLITGTEQQLTLTEKSPYYYFSSGRSYYGAFSTAPGPHREVRFRVSLQGNGLSGVTTFCPSLVYLDRSFESISSVDVPLHYVLPEKLHNGYYTGKATLPSETAYFLVYSTQFLADARVPISLYDLYTRTYEPSTIACDATGNLRITLATPSDTAG
jgi:hypothetical protein